MRLLSHNTLRNHAKDAPESLPLQLSITEFEVKENPFDKAFIQSTIPSLRWDAMLIAAKAIGMNDMPPAYDVSLLQDMDFLKASFHMLINVHVTAGMLTCAETGRTFPIVNGIPRMM